LGRLPGVPRKLRVEYPGAIYHVINRGDRREPIFKDNVDHRRFLETLAEACGKTDWQVLAYCLMPNHFHLVVETPQANLVAGMKWFMGTYTSRFNRRHKLFGHLFSGRYKALIVDGSGNGYLRTVCDYVHLNPSRAKLLQKEESLRTYRWSSFPEYLKAPTKRPAWLRVERLLGEYGIHRDSAAGRGRLEEALEQRRGAEDGQAYKAIRRGWFLGDEKLKQELLAQVSEKAGKSHYGEELRETAEAKAERIVAEELRRLGWKEDELKRQRKGHRRKVQMARRLRAETTMSLKWMAERLAMGSASMVTHCLRQKGR
jgi:REP element-mobilizing transposase RayT